MGSVEEPPSRGRERRDHLIGKWRGQRPTDPPAAPRRQRSNPYVCKSVCEPLERRVFLASTINWVNRTTFNNADPLDNRFDNVFDASGVAVRNQAMAVVDAALAFWQRVIDDFNYDGGAPSTYNVRVSMNPTSMGSGDGGIGLNASAVNFIGTKPSGGTVGIGWRTGTTPAPNYFNGWFLDPTPNDSSEFQGTMFNGFARAETSGLGADLFTGILHEMGHALGLYSGAATDVFATDTGETDTINTPAAMPTPATYWRFDGPSGRSLWTSWDSGGASPNATNTNGAQHFAPAGASVVQAGSTYSGAVALMNASFSNTRLFLSDAEARVLKDSYGYDIILPSSFGTMYNQLDADGTLRIDMTSLGASSDFIDVFASGSNLTTAFTLGAPVAGIDPNYVVTSNFPLANVQRIIIQAGDGNNTVRLRPISSSIPVTVVAGTGTDQLQIHGATNAYDNVVVDVGATTDIASSALDVRTLSGFENLLISLNGGNADVSIPASGSIALVHINGSTSAETINLNRLDVLTPTHIFAGSGNDVINLAPNQTGTVLESAVTVNAGDGADTINLAPGSPVGMSVIPRAVTVNGDNDNDILNIASGYLDAVTGLVTFNGGAGTGIGNTVVLNDTTTSLAFDYLVSPTSVTRNPSFGGLNYSNTSQITLNCSQGGNIVTVASGVNPIIVANGNDGNDNFVVGGGMMDAGAGPIAGNFNGGNGTDQITYDDHLRGTGVIWDVHPTAVYYGGIFQLNTNAFEAVGILAGNGDDQIFFYGDIGGKSINVNAGGGNDVIDTNHARALSLSIAGGAGSDTLEVDDVGLPTGTIFQYAVYPNLVTRYDFVAEYHVDYSAVETLNVRLRSQENDVYVVGTSASTQIYGTAFNDDFTIDPRDGAGNITFAQALLIDPGGGTDTAVLDDAPSTTGLTYGFFNLFGGSTLGSMNFNSTSGFSWVNTLEALTINASGGGDTFNLDSFKTGTPLTINAGAGSDLLNFGNGHVRNNITSIGAFTFNGGADYDSFYVNNMNSTLTDGYYGVPGGISILPNGAPFMNLSHAGVELVSFHAGSAGDGFQVWGTNPGEAVEINGYGGNDSIQLVGLIGTTMQNLRSVIRVNGGGGSSGNDTIALANYEDTVGRTYHVTTSHVGAAPGDNLFGPGGYLEFTGVTGTMSIYNGSGADTIYAQPNFYTPLYVDGANPATAPGDRLFLGLGNAADPVFTPAGTGAGGYTFSNCRPINYIGIETQSSDAVAPAITSIAFNPSIAGHSIAFTFSEDVSASLSSASLSLTNVAADDIQYAYAGNVATFTFPSLPGGILPSGTYTATLFGATDPAGNAATGTNSYRFIWSSGTAGDDLFRVALASNGKTVQVYENNAVAPAYTSALLDLKMIAVHGGTGGDTLVLDLVNGNPIPTADAMRFTGGDGGTADKLLILGSPSADVIHFNAGAATLNGRALTHAGIEAISFDGAGGDDDLSVLAGTVALASTQQLAALAIAPAAVVDVRDHGLIVNYPSVSPVGIWTGSAYDGVSGYIQSGRLVSSSPSANLKRLGVAEARDALAITGAQTATFAGRTVDSTSALIKFTWGGDANLDGRVNIDDYGRIDSMVSQSGSVWGWFNGDFNYDGKINIDDYGIIDANVSGQDQIL